jgi:hypothetical protein
MLVVWVLDTSASMNQRCQGGLTLLDCAKSAIEHFLKVLVTPSYNRFFCPRANVTPLVRFSDSLRVCRVKPPSVRMKPIEHTTARFIVPRSPTVMLQQQQIYQIYFVLVTYELRWNLNLGVKHSALHAKLLEKLKDYQYLITSYFPSCGSKFPYIALRLLLCLSRNFVSL